MDFADRPDSGAMPRFRLPIYEGPLDLLLHLVKRAELDPRDVTASVITEQYLEYLDLLEALNLDIAGEYLVMAATLLLIKSFSMLPHPGVDDTDEAEDLKRDLVERLLEYQRYREAAGKLAERPLLGRDVFAAPGESFAEPQPLESALKVSVFDLVEAMGAVMRRLADLAPRDIVLRDIPIEHCIPRIIERLDREGSGGRVEFTALFAGMEDRSLVIATFIALLELVRRRRVSVSQTERFGAIWIERGVAGNIENEGAKADENGGAGEASGS
jgi:segregation and condensation protein A